MPALFFDTVTLQRSGLRLPDGSNASFDQLGAGSGTLELFARQLTVEGAPDRSMTLGADRLVVAPSAFSFPADGKRQVRVAAERVEGPLSIVCPGRDGAPGAPGRDGVPAKTRLVVADPLDRDVKEPVLVAAPTAGTAGGNGQAGEQGGFVQLWYSETLQGPKVAAPGGAGGAGGKGGKGGRGSEDVGVPDAPNGARGTDGADALPGTVESRQFSDATEMWDLWSRVVAADEVGYLWSRYRVRVAEHLFRTGRPADLAAARERLAELTTWGVFDPLPDVRVLLQRLYEHVTFCGMPRDFDVPPDVDFVGQDNAALLGIALELLGHAQTVVSAAEMREDFARFAELGALQGANTLEAAKKRVEHADSAMRTAMSGTDLARGRVKNLDQKVSELETVIRNEQEANSGPFATMMQIVDLGMAVGQLAVGVSTGVGAFAAVGRGFATLEKTIEGADSVFDLVHDVKKELDSGSLKKFKTGLKDLTDAGRSIYDFGKFVSELDGIKSTHPDPKVRELAEVQRERILLQQEVALHTQMEKEAQLGRQAAAAEATAISDNIALSNALAAQLKQQGHPAAEKVVEPLLAAVRQLLDLLSIRLFATQRAKEIYLALDPTKVVRHDLGHIHPDREQMLALGQRLAEMRQDLADRAPEIITWSSLVDDVLATGDLSRGPISFWFSTEDPQLLGPLRKAGQLGFCVPVEDLFEEDGAQLFEAKFDGATIVLHGARIAGTGQSIRLSQLGRWSVRRRPDAANPDGIVKDFAFPGHDVHPQCRAVAGGVEANLTPPFNPRAEPPYSLWGRGIAGDWELADVGGIDFAGVTKVEVAFHAQALSRAGFGAPATDPRRLLRPLPGWPAPPVPSREPTPVPPRGKRPAYGYRYGVGSVAAVGASLV